MQSSASSSPLLISENQQRIKALVEDKLSDDVFLLDLKGERIGDFGVEIVVNTLLRNDNLFYRKKVLCLDNNDIGVEGLKKLEKLLLINSSIEWLDISNNKIDDDDFQYLFNGLLNNSSLRFLSLAGNQISATGCKALGKVLQNSCNNIKGMYLEGNLIDDNGCLALAQAIETNSSNLERLYLARNKVGIEGANALALALQNHNTSITYVELDAHDDNPDDLIVKKNEIEEWKKVINRIKFFVTLNSLGHYSIIKERISEKNDVATAAVTRYSVLKASKSCRTTPEEFLNQLILFCHGDNKALIDCPSFNASVFYYVLQLRPDLLAAS